MEKLLEITTIMDLKDKGGMTQFKNDPMMWDTFQGADGDDYYVIIAGIVYIIGERFAAYIFDDNGEQETYLGDSHWIWERI